MRSNQLDLPSMVRGMTATVLLAALLIACSQDNDRSDVIVESGADSGERLSSSVRRPAWQTTMLFDISTNEGFTLGQFENQVVIVEIMAGECNPCDRQHREIIDVLDEFEDEVVAVSISVQPGEDLGFVKDHLEQLGVTWRVAVMGPDLVPLMIAEFGEGIFDISSTPIILIGLDGDAILTASGLKRAFEIEGQIRRLLP
jgi:thiol-disulfide isomerase/thioredoxin